MLLRKSEDSVHYLMRSEVLLCLLKKFQKNVDLI